VHCCLLLSRRAAARRPQYFEPYVIIRRDAAPFYDERFRGYFRNKALQLHHLALMGFRFLVHPEAFIIHLPHSSTGVGNLLRHKLLPDCADCAYPTSMREVRGA
jgi:Glycosyl-transferase for dystroglycan